MSKKKKTQKIRTTFKKNREVRSRDADLTGKFREHGFEYLDTDRGERISGKGYLNRKRTVVGDVVEDESSGLSILPEVDRESCLEGRVLRSGGLRSTVRSEDGQIYQCATRRLLKTLATDQRHVVAAGDKVLFRPAENNEGIIERIQPRRGVLCRTSRSRQHIIVANVDQILIIGSAAEPGLKPHLIDRFLVTAEKAKIRPIICINKVDLVDISDLQPLVGVYGQLGYEVLLLSAETGFGIDRLRLFTKDAESVIVGQSGVGKSSLLNAIEPNLDLKVSTISSENEKGRHTTTAGQLVPLSDGGFVVDTPGIRQFQLWDVIAEEVAGLFRDLRPYVSRCRFPDCSHTHEAECAVKNAVADCRLDARRYESYCRMILEE